jgi:hypothetical protein
MNRKKRREEGGRKAVRIRGIEGKRKLKMD